MSDDAIPSPRQRSAPSKTVASGKRAVSWFGGPVLENAQAIRQRFLIITFLSIFTNLLALVQPLFMLHVYDYVLPSQSLTTLFYLTLIAVFLIGITGVLDYLRARLFADLSWDLDERLRPICFDASYELGKRAGRVGRSIFSNDLEAVKQFLCGPTPVAFLDLPWTVVFIVALFSLSPWLGLLSSAFAVLVLIAAVLNEMSLRGYIRGGTRHGREAQKLAEDVFGATDAVEGMKFTKDAVHRWSSEAKMQAAYVRAATARSGVWTSLVRSLRLALQVLTLGTAAWLVLRGELTPGVMIAASIIGARALAPIDQAVSGWRATATANDSWKRMGELTKSARSQVNEPTDPPDLNGQIDVLGVGVAAPSGKPIIADVSVKIAAGSFVGLVGASGSGKSTLARALVGAVQPDAGIVRYDGLDLRNWPASRLAEGVGYMPQSVQLLSGTVGENIRRLGPRDDQAVVEAAMFAGAHVVISSLPQGYETQIGEGGLSLSGGQRALIGLARAFYGNPKVVVLDEPTAHLDVEGRKALGEALGKLRRSKRTLVLVTHDVSALRQFDLLVAMRGGRVEAVGPPDKLLVKADNKTVDSTSNSPQGSVDLT
jgi:PrtD family type I secretion system ABC transporter